MGLLTFSCSHTSIILKNSIKDIFTDPRAIVRTEETKSMHLKDDNTFPGVEDLPLLIEQCIAKDRRAQKKLYDHSAPMLYAKIRRHVYEVDLAGEILNESFFKILTKIAKYSNSGSFEGWIHRITINTIMDFLRKKIRQEHIVKTEATEQEIPVPEIGITKIAYNELLFLIHTLPQTQRSIFNLFVFDDYSHKDIAQLLKITENNSRWHLNDARRRLKEKVDALMQSNG